MSKNLSLIGLPGSIGFMTLGVLIVSLSCNRVESTKLELSQETSVEPQGDDARQLTSTTNGDAAAGATGPARPERAALEPAAPELTPAERKQKSLAAFAQVATVLRHPRCLNCHPSGDRPHVGDERRVHGMNVQRGPENHGMAGLHCGACHRTENQEVPNIPGTPHWQLAPRSMGWEQLDDHDLAAMLIDKQRNGNRSFEDLIHHMETDPLVLWGWEPGEGRSVPPISHDDFIRVLKEWFATGAEIPNKGETTF